MPPVDVCVRCCGSPGSGRLCRSVNESVLPFNLLSRSQQLVKPFSNRTETHEAVRSGAERARSQREKVAAIMLIVDDVVRLQQQL